MRAAVEHGDLGRLMTRRRDDVEHSSAEIKRGGLIGPGMNLEEGGHLFGTVTHHRRVRAPGELLVTGNMITVGMRMRAHHLNGLQPLGLEPVINALTHDTTILETPS